MSPSRWNDLIVLSRRTLSCHALKHTHTPGWGGGGTMTFKRISVKEKKNKRLKIAI